ncbi:MAG: TolC family protein, partial [Bryobacterales bacterium]|nr:TolC family protein [Bryobacterales bacterium]
MKSTQSEKQILRCAIRSRLLRSTVILLTGLGASRLQAQKALTWDEIETNFRTSNPTLKAAQLNIDESRAEEITAYLRPNPDFSLSADGTQLLPHQGFWRPFSGTQESPGVSYLHERDHKRELRLAAAKKSTDVASSAYED